MKLTKNFYLHEFINPDILNWYGNVSLGFIDNRIVDIAQFFRDRYGKPIVINGEFGGLTFTESGLRKFNTRTGALMSQHKMGRAVDMKWEGMVADEVRADIINNYEKFRSKGLTTVEKDTDTWIHVDCRFTKDNLIRFV